MASGIYNYFKTNIMAALFNLSNGGDSIKCALLDSSHAFTPEDDAWTDVSANEISGTGYTAGGAVLANQALTIDDANDRGVWDADDPVWTTSTFTVAHVVIYDDTHATDGLICSVDLGGDLAVVAGTFTLQFDSVGIITLG